MTGRGKYLVFGVGMAVLVVGVSLAVWMLLSRSEDATNGGDSLALPQALEQILGLSEEEADALSDRLEAAAETGRSDASLEETSLAEALEDALNLNEADAGALAEQLQAAADEVGDSPPPDSGDRTSLGESLEFEVRDASGNLKQQGSTR